MVRRITSVWIQPVRPITQSNDMPVNGCVSGCAPNTKCHGGVWEISSRKPAHHIWTGPAYSAKAQLFVSETVMLPLGAGRRKTAHPVRREGCGNGVRSG